MGEGARVGIIMIGRLSLISERLSSSDRIGSPSLPDDRCLFVDPEQVTVVCVELLECCCCACATRPSFLMSAWDG